MALLREVNREVRRLGERGSGLDAAQRHQLVKREYAEGVLAAQGGRPARAPAELADVLGAPARWLAEALAAGLLHGEPDDLAPVLAGPGEDGPDVAPPPGADPVAMARELVTSARPRRRRWWRPSTP